MEQGSIVQELDAEVYRKIAGALASKQFELDTLIEIQRKKIEGKWIIELWSKNKDIEKSKRAIKEVVGKAGITETLKIPAEELKKEKEIFAEVREDEEGHLVVLAELPGVEEEDILLEVENVLKISVNTHDQKYSKQVLLPEPAKIMEKTYKHNILEVRLKKEGEKQK